MSAKLLWLLAVASLLAGDSSSSTNIGTGLPWSLFRATPFFNSSTSHLQEYARQKLSTLRYLRNKLTDHGNVRFVQNLSAPPATTSATTTSKTTTTIAPTTISTHTNLTTLVTTLMASQREEAFGSIYKNLDNLLAFTTGPLRKMVTSKQGIESLASMMMPKRDVLRKLLEIKGHLEPSLKRFLTDKYNGFLSSLVPYSENIGVPPFVLNSMKIPQDFDPRWQLIESLLKSQGGVEKFLHKMVNGDFKLGKMPELVESRTSGDDTELISDQEPDASGKGYRKQQQYYLSSFKKRLMKPVGGKVRLVQQNGVLRPMLSGAEYDTDQSGQYGHLSYDMRLPDEMVAESMAYNNGDGNMMSDVDLLMSASGHGGRGHGHGHGHGQASYGGFLDPFTILGGLAFLTYLGLMLQNSLNRNGTAMGRSLFSNDMDTLLPVPINLKSPQLTQLHQPSENHQRRGRSLTTFQNTQTPSPVTIDQVLSDMETLWKEIEKLNDPLSSRNEADRNCTRLRQCKIVWKMRVMNLEPIFASKLRSSMDDLLFLNHLMTGRLNNLCEPFMSRNCK